ncbi:major facilitator superfamily MFS_1 [Solidesulfovibrio fructosivorans JJ]]|uniref:Major facilitator superfamily MFS_1 n=1 Tax=Solidesulfovibrio fructosivorans JJ] TaxID=596151 RepID=E1JRR8_SOLFR|nr:MFS transporter [Solidesulfovibrio fructosivorans]EFL52687.1 major facilitator superfamily MFS_1 [Solidesulfovibrio fructosivorans JJ]]
MKNTNASFAKYGSLAMLMVAQIGTCGDNSTMNLITNALIGSFQATMNQIQLANIIYSLVTGALMMFGGMLGLAIGWKKNYIIGSVILVVGEISLALAPNMVFLCWVSRVLCGLGAALLVPSILGLCVVLYEGKDRALAFGSMGAATGLSSILIPPLAGYVISGAGWRWAFAGLAAYFAVEALLAQVILPEDKKSDSGIRLDYRGAILAAVGLLGLIYGITQISVWGMIRPIYAPFVVFGMSPALLVVLAGGVFLVWLYFFERNVEKRYQSCLLPSSYTSTSQVRDGLLLTSYLYICFGTVGFLVVTWAQLVAGYTPTASGLLTIAMAVPMILFSMGIPKLCYNISPHSICKSGIVITGLGCLCLWIGVNIKGINDWFIVGLFLLGAGQGFVASQSSMIIAQAVNARDAAQSGGIQASTRNVGQALGVAVIGMVLLFSLSGAFKYNIEQLPITPALKREAQRVKMYQLQSDHDFEALLVKHAIPAQDTPRIMSAYREARLTAMRRAIGALFVVVVLHLFGLGAVPRAPFSQQR